MSEPSTFFNVFSFSISFHGVIGMVVEVPRSWKIALGLRSWTVASPPEHTVSDDVEEDVIPLSHVMFGEHSHEE